MAYSYQVFIILIYFIQTTLAVSLAPEVNQNVLNFSYGINYKFNGMLNHNLDRVWIVTKIKLPKYEDIKINPLTYDDDCEFTKNRLTENNEEVKNALSTICNLIKPRLEMLKKKESHYKEYIKKILTKDIPIVLEQKSSEASRSKRAIAGLVPALTGLATIAIERVSSFISKKRNKAINKSLLAMQKQHSNDMNRLKELARDFTLYGQFNAENLEGIMNTINSLNNRTSKIEKMLQGKQFFPLYLLQSSLGIANLGLQIHLYLNKMEERHVKLYEKLIEKLKELLKAVATLSNGRLPSELFPPYMLKNLIKKALDMVHKTHPDYIEALPLIHNYYDMKLVTFNIDKNLNLIITFPILIQSFHRRPLTLYEIETVKVPINDDNEQADSYSQVTITKPYIAINKEYYIQLEITELRMCKNIGKIFYCEELFLVKHKSKHSCASVIFYKLPPALINSNCQFKYFYNTSVIPSVLDGGSQIVLANMINKKKLSCRDSHNLARPLPSSNYVLVNRSLLCNCRLEADLTYLLQSAGSCTNNTHSPVLYYTINLAFRDTLADYIEDNNFLYPISNEPLKFPIHLTDFHDNHGNKLPHQPTTLKELKSFYDWKNKGHIPRVPHPPITHRKGRNKPSFLNSWTFKILTFILSLISICLLVPVIKMALNHNKLKSLVTSMTLFKLPQSHAAPTNAPQIDKVICQDRWLTIIITGITIAGILFYLWQHWRRMTLCKGYRFSNTCSLYLYVTLDSYYIPIKIKSTNGVLHKFKITSQITTDKLRLDKNFLWDSLSINWDECCVILGSNPLPLPHIITVNLIDKMRLRKMMANERTKIFLMIKQGLSWYPLNPNQNTDKEIDQ